jgi:hypothetical protein
MQIVLVESPFRSSRFPIDDCVRYAQFALRDSLDRGECAFASHLFYTHVLRETPDERALGLMCRDVIACATNALVARYVDLGESPDMFRDCDIDRRAVTEARRLRPMEFERWRSGVRPHGSLVLRVAP